MTTDNQAVNTDSCRVCGGEIISSLNGVSSPVCSECGFVHGDGTTPAQVRPPTDQSEPDESERVESWSDYGSVTNSTENQLSKAFDILENIGDSLRLSATGREQAADIYVEAAIEKLTDGRPMEMVVSAAVCIASRELGTPIPIPRVASVTPVNPSQLKQLLRVFQRSLDRGFVEPSGADYIEFLCEDLELNADISANARTLVETFEKEVFVGGKHPVGIAVAGVYLTATDRVTQRELAEMSGVTTETIRTRVLEFREAGLV